MKNNLLKEPEMKNKYANLDNNGELTVEDLINEINDNLSKTNDIIEGMITNEKYTITNINLGLILKYDGEYKNDINNQDDNYKVIDNDEKINEYAIDYDTEHINMLLKKEEMLSVIRMFINKEIYVKMINIFFYYLNDLNYRNILLIFFHLFLNYFVMGASFMQIIIVILFTEKDKINLYGFGIGLMYLSQLLSNIILYKTKLSNIQLKYLISISLSIIIVLQMSYLYLIYLIGKEKWNYLLIVAWLSLFPSLIGIFTWSKLSMKYIMNCVPKNSLFMLSKKLSLFKGTFLFAGIIIFYLFNKYVCYFIIFFCLLMIILFLNFFTEKNSDKFYKYKTNFNELLEKMHLFDNSGEILEKNKKSSINDEILYSFERNMIRESVALEQLKAEQQLQLEKANQEFNELNQKNNFNIYNVVPDKTKFILKNLSDKTRKIRFIFLFFFQFFSVFYRQILTILTLVNYINQAEVNRNTNDEIEDVQLFKISAFDILMVFSLSLALDYLLYKAYKAFNRYNDIHSIFRFYFYINSLILFIYPFSYDSPYLLLLFVIFISFNYVMDNKIILFFGENYRDEKTPFKFKVNELVNIAYYSGKIFGSISLFIIIEKEFYFLIFGALIYLGASFYERFIKLSKIIILGRSFSKEINC